MTLRHLKIFVTVCETNSMTKAGEKLFIAQPSVSLAVAELEKYYGIQLFDRISKKLYLTESGKRFLQYATHIVRLFEEMEKEVKNFDASGMIRVGSSITIGNYLLPLSIKEFKQTHPKMNIKAIIANSDAIEKAVLENEIDLGLIEGIIHTPYILSEELADDELVMICPISHPFANQEIVVSELKKEDFLMRESGSAGREIFESMMTLQGINIIPAWESTSTQAIIRAVQAELGISVLPYLLVEESLKNKRIARFWIKDITLSRKLSVIYHKNKLITKGAKDFIDLCKTNSFLS